MPYSRLKFDLEPPRRTGYNLGMRSSERGSAIIMLFVAVALFAALAYAFMHGTRSGIAMFEGEEDKAMVTASQDCTNAINIAMKRLQARGCGDFISSESDGSNADPNAPSDGSCAIYHPNGGGVKPSCAPPVSSDWADLNIGELSSDGVTIYAGSVGGKRIYTTLTDQSAGAQWNPLGNGNPASMSTSDGMANTNALTASPPGTYPAAELCRALGPDWYLPALDELVLLYTNKNTGSLNGTFPGESTSPGSYWTSTDINGSQAQTHNFAGYGSGGLGYTNAIRVRCIRSD